MTFERFMATTMLPAECDDEEVMVGMRLAWNTATNEGHAAGYADGLKRAVEITESTYPELVCGQIVQFSCFDNCEDVANAIRKEIRP